MIGAIQEPVQQADAGFFVPTALAYGCACVLWFLARRLRSAAWQPHPPAGARSQRDVLVVIAVVAAILGLGQLWRHVWRSPGDGPLVYNLFQLVIWSPLFLSLWLRRQPLSTVYLAHRGLVTKIITGLVLALLVTVLFLALRGELERYDDVLRGAVSAHAMGHFLPVFLEAVGMAFVIERLRWCLGTSLSVCLAALLFAAAHVPGSIEDGHGSVRIAAFFAFNTALTAGILATIVRSRDVVWIGIVHYVMDVAIEAF